MAKSIINDHSILLVGTAPEKALTGSGERRAPEARLCTGLPGSRAETTQGLGFEQARHGHHAPWNCVAFGAARSEERWQGVGEVW